MLNYRTPLAVLALSVTLLGIASPTFADADLDAAFAELAAYEPGGDTAALDTIGAAVDAASKAEPRRAVIDGLAAVLTDDKATRAGKAFACRQLYRVGDEQAVPALASLLDDPELSHMARYALQPMGSNAAGEALRKALPRLLEAEQANLATGVIQSLGERGEPASVATLTGAASADRDANAETVTAARAALAKIGTPAGAQALLGIDAIDSPVYLDALLELGYTRLAQDGGGDDAVKAFGRVYGLDAEQAGTHRRIAALRGLAAARPDAMADEVFALLSADEPQLRAAAIDIVRGLPGDGVTARLVERLKATPDAGKPALVNLLTDRGDRAALPALLPYVDHAGEQLREAAIRGVGRMGDATAVPPLAAALATASSSPQIAAALERLRGEGVDDAIAAAAGDAEGQALGILLITLARRGAAGHVDLARAAARSDDATTRDYAVTAVAGLGSVEDVNTLVGLIIDPVDPRDRGRLVAPTVDLAKRVGIDEATPIVVAGLGRADAAAKPTLLELLRRLGTDAALRAVIAAVGDADADVGDAAVRELSGWPDPDAAAALLKAATAGDREKRKVLAMRGYLQTVPKLPLEDEQKAARLAAAYDHAGRKEERLMALAAIGRLASLDAMRAAADRVRDPGVGEEAALAAIAVAERIDPAAAEAVAPLLRQVVRDADTDRVFAAAKKAADRHGVTLTP